MAGFSHSFIPGPRVPCSTHDQQAEPAQKKSSLRHIMVLFVPFSSCTTNLHINQNSVKGKPWSSALQRKMCQNQ